MKLKQVLTITTAFLLSAGIGRAAHVWSDPSGWWGQHFAYDVEAPRYTGQELSLDLFGSYINPEGKFGDLFDTSIENGHWGGGVGLNYFLSRVFGIGTDFNISAKDENNLFDHWVGNVFLRLPLGNSGVAPYLVGTGGRAFNDLSLGGYNDNVYQWVYGGGVGIEYRWNPTTGLFTDGRFYFAEEGTEYNRLVIRAGLKVVF